MIRSHPLDRNNPERHEQVRDRVFSILGGVAVTSVSLLIQRSTKSELTFDNMKLTTILGVAAVILPVITEIQDRYQSRPDEGDTGNGPGNGPDDPPDEPPRGPSGPEVHLIEEIETYLRDKEPVLL